MKRLRVASLRSCGFTLIELLVVISIIAVLAALLFPVITLIRNKEKEQQARTEAASIVMALKNYRGDFFQWPGQTVQNSSTKGTDGIFEGVKTADIIKSLLSNPKQQNYIEIRDAAYVDGTYQDPWGTAYVIGMDYDGDGVVHMKFGDMDTNVADTVAVVATGKDPSTPSAGVFSW